MSGIAGLLHVDGSSPAPDVLQRAVSLMGHRGPDGTATWLDGPVGLGHLAYHGTPEAPLERLPLHSRSGRFVLTADARVDNREELWRTLSIRRPLGETTDADLILAAYGAWGEACPRHLVGAFAFAVWDAQDRSLFCARDHTGLRPFYYAHVPGERLVFASEIKGVLAAGVADDVDRERVADYLVRIVSDAEYTFYRHVRRLPPGHALRFGPDGLTVSQYWALDPDREVHYTSDAASAEAFRSVFDEAVRCRLRAPDPVGALLSGGLDSSSIAAVAQGLLADAGRPPPVTLSNVYPLVPACDERPYIDAVLESGRYAPHFVDADRVTRPLSAAPWVVGAFDQPSVAPAVSQMAGLYDLAASLGTRAVLDGHGGDEVVNTGPLYTKELALARRWRRLAREALPDGVRGARRADRLEFLYLVLLGLEGGTIGRRGEARARRLIGLGRRALARFDGEPPPALPFGNHVHPDLAREVDLPGRIRHFHEHWGTHARRRALTDRRWHYITLTSPLQAVALEQLNAFFAARGLEWRAPFWDHRLVELSLALPPDQKRRAGLGRYVLRQALHDALPPLVRDRPRKTMFSPSITHGLLENDAAALHDALASPLVGIEEYVDAESVRSTLDEATPLSWGGVELLVTLEALRVWARRRRPPT